MKNLETSSKCKASGEVKSRQYTQKGIYPTDFCFNPQPTSIPTRALAKKTKSLCYLMDIPENYK